MERFQEFVLNHPILWGAFAVVVVLLIANEIWRLLRGHRPVAPNEAVRMINSENAVVVDVRSAGDYKKGHILNAINVPLAGVSERAAEISKDTDRPILCYCAMGQAAPQACDKLRKLGYTSVHAIKGGINGWQAAGLPVTKK